MHTERNWKDIGQNVFKKCLSAGSWIIGGDYFFFPLFYVQNIFHSKQITFIIIHMFRSD